MDEHRLVALFEALAAHEVAYVLVGGAAMNVLGLIRATEDADVFVRVTEANVARLRDALRELYHDPSIDDIRAEDLAGDYPVVRYVSPDGSLIVDLLARLGAAFGYEDLEVETRELAGVPIRVASPATLYAMKRDTTRARDLDDAARLRAAFDLSGGDESETGA